MRSVFFFRVAKNLEFTGIFDDKIRVLFSLWFCRENTIFCLVR